MHTYAIHTLIDISEQEELVEAARAELAALEAERAEMREALRVSARLMEKGQYMCLDDDEVMVAQKTVKAALSSEPTGKVLVDVEKLQRLADGFHGTDGIEIGLCPVCAGKEIHYDYCWLAALLKDQV